MTHRAPEPEPTEQIPTQVKHPWRATVRTVIVSAIAILPILPDLAAAANIHAVPAVVAVLAIAAAVQRIIAIPEIDKWLRAHALLATAPPGDEQAENLDSMLDNRSKHER